MPAASAPFKRGLLHLVFLQGNGRSHWGMFSLFLGEEKQWGLLLLSQGLPGRRWLPLWAKDVTVPLGSQSGSWHKREGKVKAVPGPPAGTISVMLKALNIIPCYPESGPRRICGCFAQLWRREK